MLEVSNCKIQNAYYIRPTMLLFEIVDYTAENVEKILSLESVNSANLSKIRILRKNPQFIEKRTKFSQDFCQCTVLIRVIHTYL